MICDLSFLSAPKVRRLRRAWEGGQPPAAEGCSPRRIYGKTKQGAAL